MTNTTYPLAASDVALLNAQIDPSLLGPSSGLLYDGTNLTVPAGTALATAIANVMANPNWKTAGLQAQLIAYASQKQAAIMAGGTSVNVGSSGSPQNVEASTSAGALVLLQGAYAMAQANGSATFQWVQSNGAAVTLTAAQIITIFNAVTAFVQSTFTQLAAVIAAITAGTITTTAQVDTPPSPVPGWPVNS